MLVTFRVVFTALFFWLMAQATRHGQGGLSAEIGEAGIFALAVVVGLAAGLSWAPVLANLVPGAPTGIDTDAASSDDRALLIRAARRCEERGHPGWAAFFRGFHGIAGWLVAAGWIAAAIFLWSRREHARPWIDQFETWRGVNWSQPPALPRMEAVVVKSFSERSIQLRGPDQRLWNVGLLGVGTNAVPSGRAGSQWAAAARTNLAGRLAGRTVEFAWTQTNATHTGLGFVYVDGTNLLLGAVGDGLLELNPEGVRALPVCEQLALRRAAREARAGGVGRWGATNAVPGGAR
ncbi:MAG: hypothetical protein DVB31_02105 [Verrucomicrobia bacterium]|nr:MAG: hypothetical protein DVB31_02105 [Verrucomicrobiota bacterium]